MCVEGSGRDIDGPWSSGVQVDVGSLGKDTYGHGVQEFRWM